MIFLYNYRELVYELHKREKEVYLISGGFKSIIVPVARDLDIPTSNVYANKLKFFYDGEQSNIYLKIVNVLHAYLYCL